MSYSVHFSENSGKILLGNVVMKGSSYTPSGDTVVFTNDSAGNLMKNTALDLTKITYTPTGPVGVTAPPGPGPGSTGPTAVTGAAAVTLEEKSADEALTKAQTAISDAISSAEKYKNDKFPPPSSSSLPPPPPLLPVSGGSLVPIAHDAITAVGEAIKLVELAITATTDPAITATTDPAIQKKYEDANKKLEAINTALTELKPVLNNFKDATTATTATTAPTALPAATTATSEPSKTDLENAINKVNDEYDKLFPSTPITGGAPLRFGSSSSKTKRNRRRNRRFAKKSYKRRH